MKTSKVYIDLNIPVGPQARSVCDGAIKMGYKILAINMPHRAKSSSAIGGDKGSPTTASEPGTSKKAAKRRKLEEMTGGILSSTVAQRGQQQKVPDPQCPDWINELEAMYKGVRILKRLTIIFEDVKDLNATLMDECCTKYDLLAVIPTNHDALVACITSTAYPIDIISFDFEGPYWIEKLRVNRVKGNLAAEKDIVFEVNYAAALHGESSLENLIYTTNHLIEEVCVKKIKNLIVSSGAASAIELRSPKDATALAFLTGLDETNARHCISTYAERIVNKAGTKFFKSFYVNVKHFKGSPGTIYLQ